MKNHKIAFVFPIVLFGTIGFFRRYIPMGSATIAAARGIIGMLSLLIIMTIKKEKLSFENIKKNAAALIVSGAMIGVGWIFLFEAYNYTTIAVATLCYYMAPAFVIAASPMFFGEKITAKKLICILSSLVGMVFVSGVLNGAQEVSLKGVLFGIAAAVLYAGDIIINKKIDGISANDRTVVQLGIAGFVLVPYVLLAEDITPQEITPIAILMILILGIVHTGIAYSVYFDTMKKIPAGTVALLSYIDPVVAILISAFILSEPIGIFEVIGILCILCAAIISEMPKRQPKEKYYSKN